MIINNVCIGEGQPPYVVAEISANHNGSLTRILRTIKAAKLAGASAVKIQSFTADNMTINSDNSEFIISEGIWKGYKLYDLYKKAETPLKWHKIIFEFAKKNGITIFSTPFDETAVDFLEELNVPAYKIASFEIIDIPLIRYVAKTKKPLIISTGLASKEEISEAIHAARSEGATEIALLHCISSYPALISSVNLLQMQELAKEFKVITGLSDHTIGPTVAITSVSLGAHIIEKHFTLSRSAGGLDAEFSIEPIELSKLCKDINDAWLCLGEIGYQRKTDELKNSIFRRSIYFIRNLPAGSIISCDDIKRIRPGLGLPPKYFEDLIGKKLKQDVVEGQPTDWSLFE